LSNTQRRIQVGKSIMGWVILAVFVLAVIYVSNHVAAIKKVVVGA